MFMNRFTTDSKTVEQINNARVKIYGEDFVKSCDEAAVLKNMDVIIKRELGDLMSRTSGN